MGLGDIVQGAIGGGLGGSTFGPGGTIVGGLLGGIAGGLGGNAQDEQNKRLQGFYSELSRGAPQNGPAYTGAYSDFRNNQKNLISQLEAMAQGRGPSLATEQLKAATDRNIKQQMGLAQSGAGNATAAAMAASNNAANLGAQAAQDSAQARIQEQFNAINNLGLNLHGARDADEGMNRFNAGQQNQNMWNNQNATLENNRLRGLVLGGMGSNGPSLGASILAGGAGMFGAKAGLGGGNNNNSKWSPTPSGLNVPGATPFGGQGAYTPGSYGAPQGSYRQFGDPSYRGL